MGWPYIANQALRLSVLQEIAAMPMDLRIAQVAAIAAGGGMYLGSAAAERRQAVPADIAACAGDQDSHHVAKVVMLPN